MKYYIYGAGGHGKVALDAMQTANVDCAGFVDDKDISSWMGLSVFSLENLKGDFRLHLAIGNSNIREQIKARLLGMKFFNIYHRAAVIAKSADIGKGTFIAANAVVGPDVKLGSHCIINHGAVADHDCVIGNYSHLAPKSTLGGGVVLGTGVLIGAGAVILPGIKIADYAVIGAGAVVTKNVSSRSTVVGIPARKLKKYKY